MAPIAWPIAKLLDWLLGSNETHTYKKAELRSFLQFHRNALSDEEICILNSVLELSAKNVEEIMTPMTDVFVLSADAILDQETVDAILLNGYSRIPVHKPGNPLAFVGLLLVKKLIQYEPSRALPVSSLSLSILPEAPPSINCFQALDYFQTGRSHMLLISETPGFPGGAVGVITLEDIIEEIISEEIVDETDQYEDNVSKQRARRTMNPNIMRGIVERELASRRQTPLVFPNLDLPGVVHKRASLASLFNYGGSTAPSGLHSVPGTPVTRAALLAGEKTALIGMPIKHVLTTYNTVTLN
ncbi:hypothetical protein V5O48_013779 [Marasmius crinis-equi]|uniref:Uncharacterized protein n=1 Tax=Marasmius crinis-equi TaxID=585013 RepID=A0ABR3EZ50_9AGAR